MHEAGDAGDGAGSVFIIVATVVGAATALLGVGVLAYLWGRHKGMWGNHRGSPRSQPVEMASPAIQAIPVAYGVRSDFPVATAVSLATEEGLPKARDQERINMDEQKAKQRGTPGPSSV